MTQSGSSAQQSTTTRQALAPQTTVAPSGPLGFIADVATRVIGAILSPFIAAMPTTPPAESPFGWALLAFVRRNFFNQSPEVATVSIGAQQANTGIITGRIGGVDPDELGKTVQIRASVQAGAPVPAVCGCEQIDGLIALAYTNPATLGTAPGDTWHAPNAVDSTTVYLNPDYSLAFYRGTETGTVTIDGLGTGGVVLKFEGNLSPAGDTERSVAELQPDLGTGDLKGVTGTVISESTLNPDGSATGVLTGTVQRPELRYVVVGQPAHGTVTVDEVTGAFTYTPDLDFLQQGGPDSFQVLVTDNRINVLQIFQPYNGDPVQTINLNVTGALVSA